jgi:RRXRR protein
LIVAEANRELTRAIRRLAIVVTEPSGRGSPKDIASAPLACITSDGQWRSGTNRLQAERKVTMQYVPVVSKSGKPLMPAHPARARELLKSGKAVARHLKGLFYIQLTEREDGNVQPVACGIDPGSKREGLVVKSEKHTFINIQAEAITHVSEAVKTRRELRRGRRFRKTPYRANRRNRARGGIPPSTLARWNWKLRLCKWLTKIFPIGVFVVEDTKAKTTGKRRWDKSFSPLEVGKLWFYEQLQKLGFLELRQGWQSKDLRDAHGLEKRGKKLAEDWSAHCVDAFVLAADIVGGFEPDNKSLMLIAPIRLHRRQLHALQPAIGGVRRPYGGTRSIGFKRGSLVRHVKHGLCYVGGFLKERISLHSLQDGKRITQKAKPSDCKFICYLAWRFSADYSQRSPRP